jgi:hypothetical protein
VGIRLKMQCALCSAQSLNVAAPTESLLPNIVRHLGDWCVRRFGRGGLQAAVAGTARCCASCAGDLSTARTAAGAAPRRQHTDRSRSDTNSIIIIIHAIYMASDDD